MEPYIFGKRNLIHIINLVETIRGLARGKVFLSRLASTGRKVVLVGTKKSMKLSFGSACHGAGRRMSRHKAARRWHGRGVVKDLAVRGITIRSVSVRGVAEEAPGAYKDVATVVEASHRVGLAAKVARLEPVICIKG